MKIKTDHENLMREWQRAKEHDIVTGYSEKSKQAKDFYLGRQWEGVYAPDLDKPVLNFIRRVCSFLCGMVSGGEINPRVVPYVYSQKAEKEADIVNTALSGVIETSKLKRQAARVVLNSTIAGEGWLYWLYEKGGANCRILPRERVLCADRYLNDVQRQPYILVETFDYFENVIEEGAKNGQDTGNFTAENSRQGHRQCPMAKVVTKFYKENGSVHFLTFTKDGIITPPRDLKYELYPLAKFSWDEEDGSCRGIGVVENLIPNQIAVNKLWAMALLHQKTMAFPKLFYDRTKITSWTNKVGAAIGVMGNPNDAVATVFKSADMSEQVMAVVEKTISFTKEFMGANEASLGNLPPDNTSAILALQRSAAIPLENQKTGFECFIEDCILIILQIIKTDYGTRYLPDSTGNMEKIDFDKIDPGQFYWSVECAPDTPWAESASMETLSDLFARGILTDATDYITAIPSSRLRNKKTILKKLNAAGEGKM